MDNSKASAKRLPVAGTRRLASRQSQKSTGNVSRAPSDSRSSMDMAMNKLEQLKRDLAGLHPKVDCSLYSHKADKSRNNDSYSGSTASNLYGMLM